MMNEKSKLGRNPFASRVNANDQPVAQRVEAVVPRSVRAKPAETAGNVANVWIGLEAEAKIFALKLYAVATG